MSDDLPTKLRYAADHIDGFRDEYLLECAAARIEELEATGGHVGLSCDEAQELIDALRAELVWRRET
jgi:hypothetical protein